MPTFQFEAMDKTGQEIRTSSRPPARTKRRRRSGRWDTSSPRSPSRRAAKRRRRRRPVKKKGKTFALGGVNSKALTTFTRQLAILQDAGLPILRSLKILEQQCQARGPEELA